MKKPSAPFRHPTMEELKALEEIATPIIEYVMSLPAINDPERPYARRRDMAIAAMMQAAALYLHTSETPFIAAVSLATSYVQWAWGNSDMLRLWKPISTAPRDGSPILIATIFVMQNGNLRGGPPICVVWDKTKNYWCLPTPQRTKINPAYIGGDEGDVYWYPVPAFDGSPDNRPSDHLLIAGDATEGKPPNKTKLH